MTLPEIVFVVAMAQTLVGLIFQNRELRHKLDDRDTRFRLANHLGKLLLESKPLQPITGVPDWPSIKAWERKVETYFESDKSWMGLAFVSRFNTGSGIPIQIPQGLSEELTLAWCHVHTRRYRLEQFIKELRQ